MRGESKLVVILKCLLYATAFVPLIIFRDYISPFHFGKVVIFRSIIEIALVFYLILILKDRAFLPKFNIIIKTFGIFTIAFGLVTILSTNAYLSFWGSLERMGGWWSFLHYFVYFLILISILRTKEEWFNFLKVIIVVGVISSFYGFLQKTNLSWILGSGGRGRIFGTIGNPALFAGYQIVIMFLALLLGLSSWVRPKYKPYFLCAAFINFIAILMTAVRGSILGVAVGLIVFAFIFLILSKSVLAKKILFSLLAVTLGFIIFSFLFKNSDFVKSSSYLKRVTEFSLKTYTVQTRFWAWQAGLKGWSESPKTILFGWGPENFNIPFSKNFNPKFYAGPGSETLFDRAHNMFVEILVTMGLVGLMAYISIFVFSLRVIWKKIKQGILEPVMGAGLISLITAYIIHNCFIFDTSANFIVFFSILGFVYFLSGQEAKKNDHQANKPLVIKKIGPGLSILFFILFIISFVLILRTNILPAKANYTSTRAIIASWNKDFDGAVAKYKEAIAYDIPGKYEIRHRYAEYILQEVYGKELSPKYIEAIKLAISEVQKNAQENKLDYLPYLYLSRLNITLGQNDPKSPYNDEALRNSMKALEISPTFVRTYFEVAQAYLNKKDYESAIKYFSRATELNPEVGISFWYLGAAYLEAGDVQKGIESIDEAIRVGYSFSESEGLRLINIYLKQNNFAKISEMYEALIKMNPNNPQYHASLATAYAKIGKIDEAVLEARKAVALNKAFENEARLFIESLGRKF